MFALLIYVVFRHCIFLKHFSWKISNDFIAVSVSEADSSPNNNLECSTALHTSSLNLIVQLECAQNRCNLFRVIVVFLILALTSDAILASARRDEPRYSATSTCVMGVLSWYLMSAGPLNTSACPLE